MEKNRGNKKQEIKNAGCDGSRYYIKAYRATEPESYKAIG